MGALGRIRQAALVSHLDRPGHKWVSGLLRGGGDHLVVRSRDAYLTSFAAGSPEAVWRRRLSATDARSMSVGGRLLVIDDSAGAPGATVRTVDPITGQDQGGFGPECVDLGGALAVRLAPSDSVLAVPGTSDLVAAFGFGEGCVVRWDPDSGAVRFAVRVPSLGTVDNKTRWSPTPT